MNTSSSDFSSGCESGWTQYLVQPSSTKSRRSESMKKMTYGEYEEEGRSKGYGGGEEDLSMVSDASSGPRQYAGDDEECCNRNECSSYRNINNAFQSKQKMNKSGKLRDGSQLDDTASSHSKNKQPSMYYNGQENSGASLSKGKPSRKKYFGS